MFCKRLEKLRSAKDVTQQQMAAILGITRQGYGNYESGKREPDHDTLIAIAHYFKVSTDYLLGISDNISARINLTKIPILGQIRAGLPVLAEENWEEQIEVPANLNADFALRVVGDSMSWAGIHPGDLAVLRQLSEPQHGMIVAAGSEEEVWSATLKYYINNNGAPYLRAANPAYEDITISPGHRIIGHVVAILKEPPSILTYKDFLVSKENLDEGWRDAIETAIGLGFKPDYVKEMVEVQWQLAQRLSRKKNK